MRILPPSDQTEQYNIYEFEDWVPDFLTEVTVNGVTAELRNPEQLPSTSYRLRWNVRTQSWECDWFNDVGEPIDQGRRLSANWWIRTPWLNGFLPDPMPTWLSFLEDGDTGAECDFEGLGRTHKLVETNLQDIADIVDTTSLEQKIGAVITVP